MRFAKFATGRTEQREQKTQSGITGMTFDPGEVKKLSNSWPLEGSDGGPGRLEAGTPSVSDDPPVEEQRRWQGVAIRLAPILAVGSIPFVVLLLTSENNLRHYVSPDLLPVLGGAWAIFAI
jgi:hypothetical protein